MGQATSFRSTWYVKVSSVGAEALNDDHFEKLVASNFVLNRQVDTEYGKGY